MTKNKKFKTRRMKRNRIIGKRKRNTNTFKIYPFRIRSAIVNYVTPEYTNRNLNFIVYDILKDTAVFTQLKVQYQQYKLVKVTLIGMPRVVQGTDPAPVWIYLDTSGRDSFNYAGIQELQGARRLPVKHTSRTTYSQTGRQNDFNYWYDTQTEEGDVSIRLHSEATPSEQKFWQFQLDFTVHFRGFIADFGSNKNEKCMTIRAISGRSGDDEEEEELGSNITPDDELNDININDINL